LCYNAGKMSIEDRVSLGWGRLTWNLGLDHAFSPEQSAYWYHQPDIKDSSTDALFYLSPRACSDLYAEVLKFGSGFAEADKRLVVSYSPFITRYRTSLGSIHKLPSFFRDSPQENFASWGITETLQRDRALFIQRNLPNCPAYAACALTGIMEELRFLQVSDNEYVFFNFDFGKMGRDISQLCKEAFLLTLVPLGLLFNKERTTAPVVPCTLALCNSLPLPSNCRGLTYIDHESHSLKKLLVSITKSKGHDTWAKLVARAWVEHSHKVNRISSFTLGLSDYRSIYTSYREYIGDPIVTPDFL
jgi:hypothetical protein